MKKMKIVPVKLIKLEAELRVNAWIIAVFGFFVRRKWMRQRKEPSN